jgi:N-acetyl-gamma-glutamyl-phosphate reductase
MRVALVGASGAAGVEAKRRLRGLGLDVVTMSGRSSPERLTEQVVGSDCGVAVLCLPDVVALDVAPSLVAAGARVVDASHAWRGHPDWTYGMEEVVGTDAVACAPRVANPGCAAMGAISLLAPVAGAWPAAAVAYRPSVSCAGGASTGGRRLMEKAESGEMHAALYGLDQKHRHVREIAARSGFAKHPTFFFAVAPFKRGMCVWTSFPKDDFDGITAPRVKELYAAFAPRARVADWSQRAEFEHSGSEDGMSTTFYVTDAGDVVASCVVFDNLGAGSAGRLARNVGLMVQVARLDA